MPTRSLLLSLVALAVPASAILSLPLRAQEAGPYGLTDLHAELGVTWDGTALQWRWFIDDWGDPIDLGFDEAYGLIGATQTATRPPGSQWDFLGVAAGQPLWLGPSSYRPGWFTSGLVAEAIPAGVFDGDQLHYRLHEVRGPGHFALWQAPLAGPVVRWDTFDGLDASDTFNLTAGAHHHFNWGFTQPGLYTLVLEATATIAGVPVAVTDHLRFAVGVPYSAYGFWRLDHFTNAQLADPALSGAAADPDGGGRPNLLEYALGTDPLSVDAPEVVPAPVINGGHLTLTYLRPPGRTDVTYTVEWSADLVMWSASASRVETLASLPTPEGLLVTVRAVAPVATQPRQFLRLRVAVP